MSIKSWDANMLSLFGHLEFTKVLTELQLDIAQGKFLEWEELKEISKDLSPEEQVQKAFVIANEEAIFRGVAKMIEVNNERLFTELEIMGIVPSESK
ncbi:hypothetical protein CIG75_12980 [Tumebacillus algifaecis]|uniref:Uncharacterized protein n=1 Tax=Tumebacillus algifaecis TaxID=1214604 RepID=A0A223D307_9BACL|nr:hypothetical protein [Tumebacillus algifaecis]ASS75813.1 hypothetical protein CIG75_12980 [Tumebacillus algifaecis]